MGLLNRDTLPVGLPLSLPSCCVFPRFFPPFIQVMRLQLFYPHIKHPTWWKLEPILKAQAEKKMWTSNRNIYFFLMWRRLSTEELMLLNCGVGEDSWESLGLQGDPTSPFWRRSALGFLWKEWCSSWNSSTLATSCEELTHWKKLWCWEGLGAGGEGDDRGWDGWMASWTWWTWV